MMRRGAGCESIKRTRNSYVQPGGIGIEFERPSGAALVLALAGHCREGGVIVPPDRVYLSGEPSGDCSERNDRLGLG